MANDIMDTPLGVVFLDFKPAGAAAKIDLGKTTDATKILSEEDLKDIIIFPSAAPRMTTEIGWGADLQRTVGVEWWIFVNEVNESFGYSGYASSLGL